MANIWKFCSITEFVFQTFAFQTFSFCKISLWHSIMWWKRMHWMGIQLVSQVLKLLQIYLQPSRWHPQLDNLFWWPSTFNCFSQRLPTLLSSSFCPMNWTSYSWTFSSFPIYWWWLEMTKRQTAVTELWTISISYYGKAIVILENQRQQTISLKPFEGPVLGKL